MSLVRSLRVAALIGAVCFSASAGSAFAGQSSPVSDVALHSGGLLTGQLLNAQGKAIPNQAVHILHNEKLVAKTRTNQQGQFRIRGLRGGAHILKAAGTSQACRFWTAKAAPPVARQNVLLVIDPTVIRGQSDPNGPLVYGGSLGNPAGNGLMGGSGMWLGTGIVASASVLGGVIGFNSALDRRPPASP